MTNVSPPSILSTIMASNDRNSENISLLKEVLYKLTGEGRPHGSTLGASPMKEPAPCTPCVRDQLSDTIQQAHEIEEIARRIFEAL